MTYRLTPELDYVVQQSTIEKPTPNYLESEIHFNQREVDYLYHIKSLPRFPARGFDKKWLGVDLREDKDFKIICEGEEYVEVAVAIPATEESGCKIGIFEHNKSIFHLGQCHSCYSAKVIEAPIAGASSPERIEKEAEVYGLTLPGLIKSMKEKSFREEVILEEVEKWLQRNEIAGAKSGEWVHRFSSEEEFQKFLAWQKTDPINLNEGFDEGEQYYYPLGPK